MIRIGFLVSFSGTVWTGGLNYFSNLLHSLEASPLIEPVIVTGHGTPDKVLSEFPAVEVIRTTLVDPDSKLMLARKVVEGVAGRAFVLERLLRRHGVQALFLSGHLGPRSTFPTLGWIPDLQHIRLPEFFPPQEHAGRNRGVARMADFCTRVIVSSEDARADLEKFRPSAAAKARILHFVSGFAGAAGDAEPKAELLARYGLSEPFFHLPNQFWAHKNHRVVVDALKEAREMGRTLTVACTGHTSDFRHPEYFDDLMKHVAEHGCTEQFKVLGLIPYKDLAGLMKYSVSLINPSLFEGWSTSVEESKSLGKTMVLSDIPTHREQAPGFGVFFDPHDPRALASALIGVLDAYSAERDAQQADQAREQLPARVAGFAAQFEGVVLEMFPPARARS